MNRKQATVFGEVAELYHRYRPEYPVELFDWIVGTCEVPSPSTVVDVGAGTGKSSSFFLDRGDRVIAVEPDAAMAAVARRAARSGRLEVVPSALEDWAHPEEIADLVVSGQAWHWADPATRFGSARRLLRAGGWLCVFWNRPDLEGPPHAEELAEVYGRVVPDLASGLAAVRFPGSKAAVSAATPTEEFDQSGDFGVVHEHAVSWRRTMSAQEHCANLRTQSDHRLLDPVVLERLLSEVAEVIEAHGGSYEMPYTTLAYAAQRRSP